MYGLHVMRADQDRRVFRSAPVRLHEDHAPGRPANTHDLTLEVSAHDGLECREASPMPGQVGPHRRTNVARDGSSYYRKAVTRWPTIVAAFSIDHPLPYEVRRRCRDEQAEGEPQ